MMTTKQVMSNMLETLNRLAEHLPLVGAGQEEKEKIPQMRLRMEGILKGVTCQISIFPGKINVYNYNRNIKMFTIRFGSGDGSAKFHFIDVEYHDTAVRACYNAPNDGLTDTTAVLNQQVMAVLSTMLGTAFLCLED